MIYGQFSALSCNHLFCVNHVKEKKFCMEHFSLGTASNGKANVAFVMSTLVTVMVLPVQ